jgi:GTP-binding protein LepA
MSEALPEPFLLSYKTTLIGSTLQVAIQACMGSKPIVRETVKATRKDVLAKCYGGDVTRKRKLLDKQKEGKKKLRTMGVVTLEPAEFQQVMSTGV